MSADREENPFESPLTTTSENATVDQRHWWAIWTMTGVLALIGLAGPAAGFPVGISVFIAVIGVPSLCRTIIDLGRKQAAGWVIDVGVQLQSFCASIAIAICAIFSGCIAGFTLCFGGAMSASTMNGGYDFIGVMIIASGLLAVAAIAGLFYLMGPLKVVQLKRRAASDSERKQPQENTDKIASSP